MAIRAKPADPLDKENWVSISIKATPKKDAPNSVTRKPLQSVSLNQTIPASPLLNLPPCASLAFLPSTPNVAADDELFSPPDSTSLQMSLEESPIVVAHEPVEEQHEEPVYEEEEEEEVVEEDEEFRNFLENQAAEDFKGQMSIICETLRDTQVNWTARSKALHKLQALVKTASFDSKPTQAWVLRLKEPLAIQLSDRRSTILKETCETITAIADAVGEIFSPLMADIVPTLMKNLIVTVKIITDSSHKCILSLLNNPRLSPQCYLLAVLEGLTNPHHMMRARCSEYLAVVLSKGSTVCHRISEMGALDELEETLRKALVDSSPEVRAPARRSFISFLSSWNDRAERIWARLDYSTQRQIDTDRKSPVSTHTIAPLVRASSAPSAPSAAASSSVTKRPAPKRPPEAAPASSTVFVQPTSVAAATRNNPLLTLSRPTALAAAPPASGLLASLGGPAKRQAVQPAAQAASAAVAPAQKKSGVLNLSLAANTSKLLKGMSSAKPVYK